MHFAGAPGFRSSQIRARDAETNRHPAVLLRIRMSQPAPQAPTQAAITPKRERCFSAKKHVNPDGTGDT